MHKLRAVITDMDGTAVDTEKLQSQAYRKLLNVRGINPVERDGLVHIAGLFSREMFSIMKQEYGLSETIEDLRRERREYLLPLLQHAKPLPGVHRMIHEVKKRKLLLGLASSSFIIDIEIVMTSTKLKKAFHALKSAEGMKPKPDPAVFLAAAQELGVDPQECLALEDSETGVEAAVAAGMKVIAIPNRYTRAHNFEKASGIVKSLNDPRLFEYFDAH